MQRVEQFADKRLRVLIVEDEMSSQIVASNMLLSEGCVVEVVSNGKTATEAILKQNFDLIVLDWEMPYRDGGMTLEITESLLKYFKPHHLNERIPLVLYTGTKACDIDFPHVNCFHLMDYWHKLDGVAIINKRAKNVINRIQRRSK